MKNYNNYGDLSTVTSRNIISVSEVQQYINNSETSLTGFIQNTITNVSSQFETYCQRVFKTASLTGFYDGNGTDTLFLYQYPINSVSALQYRSTPTSTWTDFYTGSATANILVYQNYIQLYDSDFSEGRQNIRVVYNAGWETVPGDVKQVCLENVVKILTESNVSDIGKGLLNVTSINVGGGVGSENFNFATLEERTKKILNMYRRVII